jgi:putative tricarboxylic transport membrane protein
MKGLKIYRNLFWLLFAGLICREAFRLPMGEFRQPGSGFFPFAIGLLSGILALIALIQSLKEKQEVAAPQPGERFRWWNIVVILAALIAYALSLEKVGFMVNTFLFMLLLLKVVDPQTWKKAIFVGLTTAIVCDLVFNVMLGAQIPSGILGF